MKAQIIRHGEVILKPIAALPNGAVLQEEVKKHVVAHSETGHHHVLEAPEKYQIFMEGKDTYIHLGSLATLFHEKTGKDVHTPHKVMPSIYKVVIKKQYDYFSGTLQRVRD